MLLRCLPHQKNLKSIEREREIDLTNSVCVCVRVWRRELCQCQLSSSAACSCSSSQPLGLSGSPYHLSAPSAFPKKSTTTSSFWAITLSSTLGMIIPTTPPFPSRFRFLSCLLGSLFKFNTFISIHYCFGLNACMHAFMIS